jgi:hypothetical protein
MPAAAQMNLRRAVMCLPVVEEAYFLPVKDRHRWITVGVESNTELLRSLFQEGKEPGVAEVTLDDIGVIGLQNAIQDSDQLAGFLQGEPHIGFAEVGNQVTGISMRRIYIRLET